MPIFQDPERQRFYDLWSDDHAHQERQQRQQRQQGRDSLSREAWDHVDCGCEVSDRDREREEREFARLQGDRDELIQYLKSVETSKLFDRPVCISSIYGGGASK